MFKFFHWTSVSGGNRYFKVDQENNKVWQIVLHKGVSKTGRPHCEGIYKISYATFLGHYYWFFGRKSDNFSMVLTTENQYKQALETVVKTF